LKKSIHRQNQPIRPYIYFLHWQTKLNILSVKAQL